MKLAHLRSDGNFNVSPTKDNIISWFSLFSELNYIFGSPFTGLSVDTGTEQPYSELDKKVSKQMMILWTNFAKYGWEHIYYSLVWSALLNF